MNGLESVQPVLYRHKQELMERYDAVGVGIGKDPSDTQSYVIVVYLRTADHQPAVRRKVEGIPLVFQVTGEFKAHNQTMEE